MHVGSLRGESEAGTHVVFCVLQKRLVKRDALSGQVSIIQSDTRLNDDSSLETPQPSPTPCFLPVYSAPSDACARCIVIACTSARLVSQKATVDRSRYRTTTVEQSSRGEMQTRAWSKTLGPGMSQRVPDLSSRSTEPVSRGWEDLGYVGSELTPGQATRRTVANILYSGVDLSPLLSMKANVSACQSSIRFDSPKLIQSNSAAFFELKNAMQAADTSFLFTLPFA